MKRKKFSLSHYHLTSFDMGQLIPIGCVEVLPGDSFQHQTSALVRVTPQLKPIMHPCHVHIQHFFVPNRILWSGWEDFITGESATPPPTISGGTHTAGALYDYLGVFRGAGVDFNALPVRAYNAIFNEYFRDQDLVAEVDEDSLSVQNVAWEKDYFTTARPWALKGDAVTIPLGLEAPVKGIGVNSTTGWNNTSGSVRESDGTTTSYTNGENYADIVVEQDGATGFPNIRTDLSAATGMDIIEFREAFAMQRYQEARARYGSRYADYLRYLGVNPRDSRLQKPEFLGGGRQTIAFSEVLNTASNDGVDPLGQLGGHGIAALRSNRYRRFFNEHGWVISLMYVRPKAIYCNNIPRKFFRGAKEDYWQRELQHVGAQEVFNKELRTLHTEPDGVFGYSERYAEYRSEPSRVSSEFRNSISYDWHLGRIFLADMALNEDFVKCSPTKRVFAEQTKNSLWVMANHSIQARRMVAANTAVGMLK